MFEQTIHILTNSIKERDEQQECGKAKDILIEQ
jgi:hypothetical protein